MYGKKARRFYEEKFVRFGKLSYLCSLIQSKSGFPQDKKKDMTTKNKRLYQAIIVFCLLVFSGIVYYYFFCSFSAKDTRQYLYIDDDELFGKVAAEFESIMNEEDEDEDEE